jgi:hypothetical protein
MYRPRVAVAATLFVTTLCAGSLLAQNAPQPPPMTAVLAGRKVTPPVKGEALVEYTTPVTRREKNMVITRITVRNASDAPIPRLAIDETFYDKSNQVVIGGTGVIPGLFPPGDVQTVTIETPFVQGMLTNQYQFRHANGTVKPTRVDKIEPPPDTSASAAPAP